MCLKMAFGKGFRQPESVELNAVVRIVVNITQSKLNLIGLINYIAIILNMVVVM